MTGEQKAALINSQTACALIKAMGMKTANDAAIDQHACPPHQEFEFENLISDHSLDYNAVINLFNS